MRPGRGVIEYFFHVGKKIYEQNKMSITENTGEDVQKRNRLQCFYTRVQKKVFKISKSKM